MLIERRSKRSCRLPIVKSEPIIVEVEAEVIVNENEIKEEEEEEEEEEKEEDPADIFQLGDLFWVRVPGNPWWPAMIYGK